MVFIIWEAAEIAMAIIATSASSIAKEMALILVIAQGYRLI